MGARSRQIGDRGGAIAKHKRKRAGLWKLEVRWEKPVEGEAETRKEWKLSIEEGKKKRPIYVGMKNSSGAFLWSWLPKEDLCLGSCVRVL